MSKQIINIKDGLSKNLKDDLKIGDPELKGAVEIYDKNKDGSLSLIREKHNLIVYGGREWLLRKAFGTLITGHESNIYQKELRWFAVGQGGGEPGNPLQAGATIGSDSQLLSQVPLRTDLEIGDSAHSLYASSSTNRTHGYFKQFASVILKEDHANPYVHNNITRYPPLIAEIRIELSADDANGSGGVDGWVDLNEAGLFVADPNISDPGQSSVDLGGSTLGHINIRQVIKDSDYAIYILDTLDLNNEVPGLNQGDYMYVTGNSTAGNNIAQASSLLVVDVFPGETSKYAYVVVEKPDAVNEDPGTGMAHFTNKLITPYIMFSRVCFSSVRKSIDREIVFLWKIYF